jgi:hypothetical protein
MIIDNPASHFIFIFHSLAPLGKKYTVRNQIEMTNGEVLQYWGKWIILGERAYLDEMARKLDPLVEQEKIPCVKYDRTPSVNLDLEECVMMVYGDRRDRDGIFQILRSFGVKLKAWITEKETMELWLPGGQLLERWLAGTDFDNVRKDIMREDARMRLTYIFDHPDEIFTPWMQ